MKTYYVQSAFLSGVLDPRAAARIDTEAYNQALYTGVNIEPIHLGGVRRRRGLRYRAELPNRLTRITSGITVTAPEGGTTDNANDYDEATLVTTTSTVGTTDPFVVVHYDLGSAKAVKFADVLGIKSSGGSSTEFCIQYSEDDLAWTTLGDAFTLVDTTSRGYRRLSTVTARYWRVVKIGGTDMGAVTVSLAEFNLWQDAGTISAVRLIPFEVSADARYVVALTDYCASIYQDGALVSYVPTPYASADLAEIDAAADAETMVLVHEDYPPRFLLLEGADNFQCELITFSAIPQIDYADRFSPTPTSEVQAITFSAGWVQGNTFQIELESARTGTISYAGDATAAEQEATAANIAREVQKLYTVPGFDGVSCSRTGVLTYTVTFANASAKPYKLMNLTPLSAASGSVATVARLAAGVARSEDVWSATRGYPRTVAFFEGRLFFGGTRSRQQSILGSEVSNILNFEILEGLDGDAIFTTLNGPQLNAVTGLFGGRNLQLFTTGGEFRYAKAQGEPITPGDVPVIQTLYGSAKIRPVSIDGATLYVQKTQKAIRDFRYDYEEDAYNSLGVSSLAPHLINSAVDIAAWNGSSTDEIGLVFVVNGDGTVAVFNSRKEANVQAWCQWTTTGSFKAVGVVREDIYFAVLRDINGTDKLFLEQADPDYYTDCGIKVTQASSTAISGLSHLNGESCRVKADGFVLDDITPSGGTATLSRASESIEVGLNFNPTVTPMPLSTVSRVGPNFVLKRRMVKVRVKVRNTLGLLMNGRVLADRQLDIDNFDTAPTPFTGTHAIEETTNWDESEDKLVTFSQVDPLPMEILGIVVQLEAPE